MKEEEMFDNNIRHGIEYVPETLMSKILSQYNISYARKYEKSVNKELKELKLNGLFDTPQEAEDRKIRIKKIEEKIDRKYKIKKIMK